MCENENTKSLLAKVNRELPALESTNYNNLGYNIFSVLEVERKEVIMCRMLADLLDSHGYHGCGDVFLSSFLEKVIKFDIDVIDDIIPFLRVTKEYQIDSCSNEPDEEKIDDKSSKNENSKPSRIDIVIHGAGHFIPIEVKIDEKEHDYQCLYYYDFAKKIDPTAKIYYLTKYGDIPQNSYSYLGKEKCKCISFEKNILPWLELSISQFKGNGNKTYDILCQYKNSICNFTNARQRQMDDKYAKVIVQSDNIDDLITSVGIAKSFTTIQDNLIIEFFERIEQGITLKMGNLKVVDDTQDIKNHWKMFQNKHFFGDVFSGDKYTSGNPCTCFEVTGTNYRIYIHIENRVWAELHDGQSRNGDWIYLPTGGPKKTENIPNYFTMNNAAIALHDSEKMDRFIDESINLNSPP